MRFLLTIGSRFIFLKNICYPLIESRYMITIERVAVRLAVKCGFPDMLLMISICGIIEGELLFTKFVSSNIVIHFKIISLKVSVVVT